MTIAELSKVNLGIKVDNSDLSKSPTNILYLKVKNIVNGKVISESDALYVKNVYKNKYQGVAKLSYGDYLIFRNNEILTIFKYENDLKKIIIPSNEFIVISSENTWLNHFIEKESGKNYLSAELKDIYSKTQVPGSVLTRFSRIDIPLVEDTDFEEANEEVYDVLKQPTDVSKIRVDLQILTITNILTRIKLEEIQLHNYFQRSTGLWSQEIKSRLIESMLIKLPIPAFYFDGSDEDNWLVVDGLQRISAIKEFMLDGNLQLKGLDYLPNLEGKYFRDLDRKQIRILEDYNINAYVIDSITPTNVRYKIFRSINTSSLNLEKQEIRHALNQGKPTQYLEMLVSLSIFSDVIKMGIKQTERMEDRELALRYVAFRMTRYTEYKPSIVEFLDNAMTKLYTYPTNKLDIFAVEFGRALHIINMIFGEVSFTRNMFDDTKKWSFYNVLFEIWIYAVSDLDENECSRLIEQKNRVKKLTKDLIQQNDFERAIDNAYAYTIESVKIRFSKIESLIKDVLKK